MCNFVCKGTNNCPNDKTISVFSPCLACDAAILCRNTMRRTVSFLCCLLFRGIHTDTECPGTHGIFVSSIPGPGND